MSDQSPRPTTPLILCVDIEPDERELAEHVDPLEPWQVTDECLQLITMLRRVRQDRTGERVLVNWFWRADPQIVKTFGTADFAPSRFLERLTAEGNPGDVHGNHPHAWRWSDSERCWFNDFGNADWIAQCIQMSHETLLRALPQAPTCVRFGDRFTSAAAVNTYRSLGYRFDLTPEPGHPLVPAEPESLSTGAMPDYRRTPGHPYFPAKGDPTVSAWFWRSEPIRMLPVTTHRFRWLSRRYPFLWSRVCTLNLGSPPQVVSDIMGAVLRRRRSPLVAVMRSGDFARRRQSLEENLRHLFNRDDIRFETPYTYE